MQSHEAAITSGELMRIAGEGIATRCLQAEGLLSVASRAGELRTEHGYGDIRLDLATPEGNSNGQGVFLFKYQAGLDVIECSSAASCGAITYAEEIPYDAGEATPERIGRMAQAVVSVGDRRGSGVHSLEDTFCDYAFGPHSKFAIGRAPNLVTVFGGLSVLGARLAAEAATGRDTQAAVSFGIIPDNFRAIMDVSSLDDALTTQLVATDGFFRNRGFVRQSLWQAYRY